MKKKKSLSHHLVVLILRLLLLGYIGSVAYLCFGRFDNMHELQKFILGIPTDKAVHFCMFVPFPVIAYYAYDRTSRNTLQLFAILICVCSFGCVYAGITEIIQGMLPHRTQDIYDFAFDCMAIGISTLGVFVVELSRMSKSRRR